MMRACVLVLVLCAAGAAGAAPTAEVAKAKEEFRKAEAYLHARAYDRAIEHYRKAYELSRRPTLLFDIAVALDLKGDRQKALETFQAFIAADPTSKYVPDAQKHIATLLKGISAERAKGGSPPVETTPPPTVETRPEPPPPLPLPPQPVATAPVAPAEPIRDEAPRDDGGGIRIAGLVTAGVGVALVATGVVFALKAKSASNDLADLGTWDQDIYDSGRSANRNMFIFLGAGAAAIATGAILTFVVGRPSEGATVVVTPTPTGVLVQGRFSGP